MDDTLLALVDANETPSLLYGVELSGPAGDVTLLEPIEVPAVHTRRSSAPPPKVEPDGPSEA